MARKQKTQIPEKGEVPFGNVQWVLNNLTFAELDDLDNRNVPVMELNSFVQRMIETGWRMSVKWTEKNKGQAVQITFIQARYEYPNAGFAFSGFSTDWIDALAICWYKFTVIANGVLGEFATEAENVRG